MKNNKYADGAERDHAKVDAEKLKVSFDYLDLDSEYFFIHGLSVDHYRKIFECINTLSKSTEAEISKQTHSSLVPKSIFNQTGTYSSFPEHLMPRIAEKLITLHKKGAGSANDDDRADALIQAKKVLQSAFEVRVGKTYGRIHGIIWDKVFYIVWFDPAHNLYPDSRHGIKLHDAFATVRSFEPEAVATLRSAHEQRCAELGEEFAQLKLEHDELLEQWAK